METRRHRLVIEDRTKHKPGSSFAGRFVVFEVRDRPFPHGLYVGDYATLREAQEAAARHRSK